MASPDIDDLHMQLAQQQVMIEQLRVMIREREDSLQNKDKELQETNSKLSKLKLQAKARVAKEAKSKKETEESTPRKDATEAPEKGQDKDETLQEKGSIAKLKLMKKKLDDRDLIIRGKEEEISLKNQQIQTKEKIIAEQDTIIENMKSHLEEKTKLMEEMQGQQGGSSNSDADKQVQHMYAQILYKDRMLLDLNNKILELERRLIDLQEFVGEKNEVIRGRDKVIQILQADIKEKGQSITDQAMLISRLTAKVEKNDENMSILEEQVQKAEHDLKVERDRFDLRLRESNKYFEETLKELEDEVMKLRKTVQAKDADILIRENDLRELISRHEKDIQKIISKAEVNIENSVIQMLEQKLKNTNEVLAGKIQVIEVLQKECTSKERQLLETQEIQKSFKEKLQVMSEQMMLSQASFVDQETQWMEERKRLQGKMKDFVEKHEHELTEKELELQTVKSNLSHYEEAYRQATSQYSMLQERYHQTVKPGGAIPVSAAVKTSDPTASSSGEITELKQELDKLKSELKENDKSVEELASMKKVKEELEKSLKAKEEECEELKKSVGEGGSKSETKMLKMKAQLTSKVKALEKELEELRKGSDLAGEVTALKNKLAELEDEKGNLQLKLVDFDETTALQEQLEKQTEGLKGQIIRQEEENSKLKEELTVIIDERDKLNQIISDLQDTVDQNQVEHDQGQQNLLSSLQTEVGGLSSKVSELEEERDIEKTTRINTEMKLIDLEERHKTALKELSELHEKLVAAESLSVRLQQELEQEKHLTAQLKSEKVSLEIGAVEEEEQIEVFKKEKTELVAEVQRLKEKIDKDMQQPIFAFEKENEELHMKIKDLQVQLETESQLGKDQLNKINQLTEELETLNRLKVSLNSQISSFQLQTATLEEKLFTLESEKREIVTSQELLQKEKNELSATIYDLQQEQKHLSERLSDLQQEKDYLTKSLTEHQQELNQLRKIKEEQTVEIQGLRQELHLSAEEKTLSKQALQQSSQESQDMKQRLDKFTDQLGDKERHLEEASKKLGDLELDIVSFVSAFGSEQRTLSEMKDYFMGELQRNKNLSEQVDHYKDQLTEKERLLEEAFQKIREMEKDISNFLGAFGSKSRANLSEILEYFQSEFQRINTLCEQVTSQEETIAALQADIDSANSSIQHLKSSHKEEVRLHLKEKKQLQSQLSGHMSTIEELEKSVKEKFEIIHNLNSISSEKDEYIQQLQLENKHLSRELEVMREGQTMQGDEFELKIQTLLSQMSDLEKEVANQKSICDKKDSEIERLHASMKEVSAQVQTLKAELDSVRTENINSLESKEYEIQQLKEQNDNCVQAVNELKNMCKHQEDSLQNKDAKMCELTGTISSLKNEIGELGNKVIELRRTLEEQEVLFAKQVQSLEQQSNQAQELADGFQQECVSLQSHLEEKNMVFNTLTQNMDVLSQGCLSKDKMIQSLQNDVESLNSLVTEKESMIETSSLQLELVQNKVKQSELEKSGAVQSLTEDAKTLKTKILEYTSQIDNLKEHLSEKESKVSNMFAENEKLLEELSSLNVQVKNANFALEKSLESSKEKDEQIQSLMEQVKSYSEKCSVVEKKDLENLQLITELKNNISLMHESISKKDEEIQGLSEKLHRVSKERDESHCNFKELQESLNEKISELTKMETYCANLQRSLDDAVNEHEVARKELADSWQKVSHFEAEQRDLVAQEELRTIQNQLEIERKERQDLEGRNIETIGKFEDLTLKYSALAKEHALCASDKTELQARLNDIEGLKSELEERISHLTEGIGNFVQSNETLEKFLQESEKQVEELSSEKSKLEHDIQDLSKKHEEMLEEKQHMSQKLTLVSETLACFQKDLNNEISVKHNLESELDMVTKNLIKLRTAYENMEKTKETMESMLQTTEKQLIIVTSEKDLLLGQLSEQHSLSEKIVSEIASQSTQISVLSSEIDEKDQHLISMKAELTLLSSKIEEERNNHKQEILAIRTSIEKLQTELHMKEELEKYLKDMNSELERRQVDLEKMHSSALTESEGVQQIIDSLTETNHRLEAALKAKECEHQVLLSTSNEQVSQLQKVIENQNNELQQSNESIEQLKSYNVEMNKDLESAKWCLEEKETSFQNLLASAAISNDAEQEKEKEIEVLKAENESLQQSLYNLKEELQSSLNSFIGIEGENQQMETEINTLKEERKDLYFQISVLQKEKAKLDEDIVELNMQITAIQTVFEEKEGQVKDLNQQIESLQNQWFQGESSNSDSVILQLKEEVKRWKDLYQEKEAESMSNQIQMNQTGDTRQPDIQYSFDLHDTVHPEEEYMVRMSTPVLQEASSPFNPFKYDETMSLSVNKGDTLSVSKDKSMEADLHREEISEKDIVIKKLKDDIRKLTKVSKGKDAKIKRLEQEKDSFKSQCELFQEKVGILCNQLEHCEIAHEFLKSEFENLEVCNKDLEYQCLEKDKEIDSLYKIVKDKEAELRTLGENKNYLHPDEDLLSIHGQLENEMEYWRVAYYNKEEEMKSLQLQMEIRERNEKSLTAEQQMSLSEMGPLPGESYSTVTNLNSSIGEHDKLVNEYSKQEQEIKKLQKVLKGKESKLLKIASEFHSRIAEKELIIEGKEQEIEELKSILKGYTSSEDDGNKEQACLSTEIMKLQKVQKGKETKVRKCEEMVFEMEKLVAEKETDIVILQSRCHDLCSRVEEHEESKMKMTLLLEEAKSAAEEWRKRCLKAEQGKLTKTEPMKGTGEESFEIRSTKLEDSFESISSKQEDAGSTATEDSRTQDMPGEFYELHELEMLKSKCCALSSANDNFLKEIKKLKKIIKGKEAKSKKFEEVVLEQEKLLSGKEADRLILQERLTDLMTKVGIYSEEISDLRIKLKALQQERELSRSSTFEESDACKESLDEISAKLDESISENTQMALEMKKLQMLLKGKDAKVKKCEERVHEQEKLLSEKETSNLILQERIKDLTSKMSYLHEEESQVRAQIKAAELECVEWRERYDSLRSEIDSYQSLIDQKEMLINDLQKNVHENSGKIEALEKEKCLLLEEKERLSVEVRSLRTQMDEKQKNLDILNIQLNTVLDEKEQLSSDLNKLQKVLKGKEAKVKKLEEVFEEQNRVIADKDTEVVILQERFKDISEKLMQELSACEELRAKLDESFVSNKKLEETFHEQNQTVSQMFAEIEERKMELKSTKDSFSQQQLKLESELKKQLKINKSKDAKLKSLQNKLEEDLKKDQMIKKYEEELCTLRESLQASILSEVSADQNRTVMQELVDKCEEMEETLQSTNLLIAAKEEELEALKQQISCMKNGFDHESYQQKQNLEEARGLATVWKDKADHLEKHVQELKIQLEERDFSLSLVPEQSSEQTEQNLADHKKVINENKKLQKICKGRDAKIIQLKKELDEAHATHESLAVESKKEIDALQAEVHTLLQNAYKANETIEQLHAEIELEKNQKKEDHFTEDFVQPAQISSLMASYQVSEESDIRLDSSYGGQADNCEGLLQEKNNLKADVTNLKQLCKQKDTEITKLDKLRAELERELHNKEEALIDAGNSNAQLRYHIETLEKELEDLKWTVNNSEMLLSNRQESDNINISELAYLRPELEKKEKECQENQKVIQNLKMEVDRVNIELEQRLQELLIYQKNTDSLNFELHRVRSEIHKENEELPENEMKSNTLGSSIQQFEDQHHLVEEAVCNSRKLSEQLQSERDFFHSELEQTRISLDKAKQEGNNLQDRIRELEEQMSEESNSGNIISRFQAEIKELHDHISSLQSNNEEYLNIISLKDNEIEKVRKSLQQKDSILKSIQGELDLLSANNKQLSNKKLELEALFEVARKETEELRIKAEHSAQELITLKEMLIDKEREMSRSLETLQQSSSAFSETKEQLSKLWKEKDKLVSDLQELSSTNVMLNTERSQMMIHMESIQNDLSQKDLKLLKLNRHLSDVTEENEQLRSNFMSVSEAVRLKTEELGHLSEELSSQQQEFLKLSEIKADMDKQIEILTEKLSINASDADEFENMKAELAQVEEQMSQEVSINAWYQEQILAFEDKSSRYEIQIASLKEQVFDLETKVRDAGRDHTASELEKEILIAERNRTIETLEQENLRVLSELQHVKNMLDDIETSHNTEIKELSQVIFKLQEKESYLNDVIQTLQAERSRGLEKELKSQEASSAIVEELIMPSQTDDVECMKDQYDYGNMQAREDADDQGSPCLHHFAIVPELGPIELCNLPTTAPLSNESNIGTEIVEGGVKEPLRMLEQQLQEKQAQIETLQMEIEKAEATITMVTNKVQEKNDKVASLLENMQEMEERLAQLSSVEEEMAVLKKELQEKESSVMSMKKSLEESDSKFKKVLATAKKLKQQSNEHKELADKEKERREAVERELSEKIAEVNKLNSQFAEYIPDNLGTRAELNANDQAQLHTSTEYSKQLQEQIQALTENIHSADKEKRKLEDSFDELRSEYENLKEKLEVKSASLSEAEAELEKLREKLKYQSKEHEEIADKEREERRALERELNDKVAEIEKLKSHSPQGMTDNVDSKERPDADVQNQLQIYLEFSHQLQEQVQNLTEKNHLIAKEKKQVEDNLRELKSGNEDLRAELEVKSTSLANVKADIEELRDSLKSQMIMLEEKEKMNRLLQEELTRVTDSLQSNQRKQEMKQESDERKIPIQHTPQEVDDLKKKLKTMEEMREDKDLRVLDLTQQVESNESTIQILQGELRSNIEEIEELRETIQKLKLSQESLEDSQKNLLSEKDGKITELTTLLDEKDSRIEDLCSQLEGHERNIQILHSELKIEQNRKESRVHSEEEQQTKIQELQNELHELHETIKHHKNELESKSREIENLLTTVENLRKERESAVANELSSVSAKEEEITQLSQTIGLIKAALQDKDDELNDLKTQAAGHESNIHLLHSELANKMQEIARLEQAMIDSDKKWGDNYLNLQQSLSEKEEELAQARETIVPMQQNLESKDQRIHELLQQTEIHEHAIDSLQDELHQKEIHLKEHAESLNNSEREKFEIDEERQSLKKELEELQIRISQSEDFVSSNESLLQSLQADNTELREFLSEKENELKASCEDLNEIKTRLSEKEYELENMLTELDVQKSHVVSLESEMVSSSKEVETLKLRISNLEHENQLLKNEVTELMAAKDELLNSDEQLIAEHEALKSEFMSLQTEKENTEKSMHNLIYEKERTKEEFENYVSQAQETERKLKIESSEKDSLMEALDDKLQQMTSEKTRLQGFAEELKEDKLFYENKARDLQNELQELKVQYEKLSAKFETVSADNQSLNKSLNIETARQVSETPSVSEEIEEIVHKEKSDLGWEGGWGDSWNEEVQLETVTPLGQMTFLTSESQQDSMSIRDISSVTESQDVKEIEKRLDETQQDNDRLQKEVDDLKEQYKSVTKECENVKVKLQVSETKCEKMLLKLKILKEKNDRLQEEMKQVRDQITESKEEDDSVLLKKQLNDTQLEKNEMVKRLDEKQHEIESLMKNLSSKQLSIDSLTKQLHDEQCAKVSLTSQLENKQLEVETVIKHLNDEQLEKDSLVKQEYNRQSEVESLLKQLNEKQFEIDSSMKLLHDKQVEVDSLGKQVTDLSQKYEEEIYKKKEATDLINSMKQNIDKLNEDIRKLKDQNTEIQNERDIISSQLEAEIAKVHNLSVLASHSSENQKVALEQKKEIDILRDSLATANASLEELGNRQARETSQLADMKEQYQMLEEDNKGFQDLVEKMSATNNQLKTENIKQKMLIEKLQAESSLISEQRQDSSNEFKALKDTVKELESEKSFITEEIEGLQQDLLEAKRASNKLSDELKDVMSKLIVSEKSEEKLDQIRQENKSFKEEVEDLKWRLEELKEFEVQNEKLLVEVLKLEKEKEELTNEVKVLQHRLQEMNELGAQFQSLQAQFHDRNVAAQSLHTEHIEQQEELRLLRSKTADFEEVSSNLEKALAENESFETVLLKQQEELKALRSKAGDFDKLSNKLEEALAENKSLKKKIVELNMRLEGLTSLEKEYGSVNEEYNKVIIDNSSMAKQIEELYHRLRQKNDEDREAAMSKAEKDHLDREKETLHKRIEELETKCKEVTDYNVELTNKLTQLKGDLDQANFEKDTLKAKIGVMGSGEGKLSKYQLVYEDLQKQFTAAVNQKNQIQKDLNHTEGSVKHLEARCQQLALQVSHLAEDRSYLNIQLGTLSRGLREKEQEYTHLQKQYRLLHHTLIAQQTMLMESEKKIVSMAIQKSPAPTLEGTAETMSRPSSRSSTFTTDTSSIQEVREEVMTRYDVEEEEDGSQQALQQELKNSARRLGSEQDSQEFPMHIESSEDEELEARRIRAMSPMLSRQDFGYIDRINQWMKIKKAPPKE